MIPSMLVLLGILIGLTILNISKINQRNKKEAEARRNRTPVEIIKHQTVNIKIDPEAALIGGLVLGLILIAAKSIANDTAHQSRSTNVGQNTLDRQNHHGSGEHQDQEYESHLAPLELNRAST